jgi:hypothetical protein
MPTDAEMSKAIKTLIAEAKRALWEHRCNDADAACKKLLKYHSDHLNEMPPKLVSLVRETIAGLAPRVYRCFLKWGTEA